MAFEIKSWYKKQNQWHLIEPRVHDIAYTVSEILIQSVIVHTNKIYFEQSQWSNTGFGRVWYLKQKLWFVHNISHFHTKAVMFTQNQWFSHKEWFLHQISDCTPNQWFHTKFSDFYTKSVIFTQNQSFSHKSLIYAYCKYVGCSLHQMAVYCCMLAW